VYDLIYDQRITKDIRRIHPLQRRLILHRIEQLASQPRRPQVEKLTGLDAYRLRVGDYRILFTIDDRARRVTVYRILHRRDAYR